MTAPALRFRPMRPDAADLERMHRVFADHGGKRSLRSFEWQYLRNPAGALYVDLAEDETTGALASVYASLPQLLRVGGRVGLALQSLDTLTAEAYRGRGLFPKLAKSLYSRAAADGASLVFGFPNGNSAPGFFSRLEWTSLDPVPFLVRPMRTSYIARRLPLGPLSAKVPDVALPAPAPSLDAGEDIRVLRAFDSEVDDLWWSVAGVDTVAVERNAAYLNWRFVDKPDEHYLIHGLYDGGGLQGVVVSCTKEKHGGRVAYILELLYRPGRADVGRALLRTALRCAALARADLALAWCFDHSPTRAAFRSTGFFTLPERLRPIELHVGAHAFRPTELPVGNRRSWYLSYADSDTV